MHRDTPRVVIVGAGIAGITMAVNLRNKLRHDNFVIYEKAGSIGGTVVGLMFPGTGTCLSTEPNPYWENYYITQPEIRAYWEKIYRKHDLASHTVFNTRVTLVEWDEENGVHNLTLEDVMSGQTIQTQAETVIQAVGFFTTPMYPDIPGKEKFTGPLWHSSQWRHDVDLKGMTVGVVGNGCSATQFIPAIAAEPTTRVINFCRTPQWIGMRSNYHYPEWAKWAFAHVPFLLHAYRSFMMITVLTWYMRRTAPAKYHDNLIPTYPPGCKRLVLDSNYLAALHQPNVDLNWTGIQEIVEDGIVLKTGNKVPLDAIIFGTGFYLAKRDVVFRGIGGHTLKHYFESEGGYYGTVFPGFPNLFTIVGPNSASAHASLIFIIETQVNYIMKLMKPIINGKAKSLEVTQKATTYYNTWIQRRMASTIFLSCFSYYRGDNRTGAKNVATFPGMISLYWWITRKPRWDDFKVVGGEQWFYQRRKVALMNYALVGLMVSVVGYNFSMLWKLVPGRW
ncbi:FAD/NAD(P)-binding domain-containing protein [Suillus subaureus]|uniref:FAD/NAD(P)-binding domain-containing protein n=1 Tax=Suillus subaureus TaxID=48587 RepID=A0A9P7JKD7_9AGAM|nr:FAD/NAD(P)-binding domain-containing protein [Suillus subaureus]KAG1827114.1 FAD/NAD(P)-binding domain-containing protein [Suillus subaureus]